MLGKSGFGHYIGNILSISRCGNATQPGSLTGTFNSCMCIAIFRVGIYNWGIGPRPSLPMPVVFFIVSGGQTGM